MKTLRDAVRDRERALDHFLSEWASSLKKMERSELAYQTVVDAHRAALPEDQQITADYRAASSAALKEASGNCSYFRDRAIVYGISALVELARGTR